MIDAPVHSRTALGGAELLTVALPTGIDLRGAAGRFFLARCAPGDGETRAWDPFLRQPLFPVLVDPRGDATLWSLLLPPADGDTDGTPASALQAEVPAAAFLRGLRAGETLNLLGPYGSGFTLEPRTRSLLLAADLRRAPLLFPLIEEALDQGARVTLLLAGGETQPEGAPDPSAALLAALPIAVEAHIDARDALAASLAATAPWADQICVALPNGDYAQIAARLRLAALRPTPGSLQAFVESPLPCGVGACLGCVIPLAGGGHTRACVHGPVMDLLRIG